MIHRESPDDAEGSDDSEPEPAPPVIGRDGKTYAKRKARHTAYPLTETFRRRLRASRTALIKLRTFAESDGFDPGSLATDADALRSDIDAAISALTEIRAQLASLGGEDDRP